MQKNFIDLAPFVEYNLQYNEYSVDYIRQGGVYEP